MSENKCFCHFNGYEVKDARARKTCEELNEKIEATAAEIRGEIPEVAEGVIEQNDKRELDFWVGSKAEYEALEIIKDNCFYIITDETWHNDVTNLCNAAVSTANTALSEAEGAQNRIGVIDEHLSELEAAHNMNGVILHPTGNPINYYEKGVSEGEPLSVIIPDLFKYTIVEVNCHTAACLCRVGAFEEEDENGNIKTVIRITGTGNFMLSNSSITKLANVNLEGVVEPGTNNVKIYNNKSSLVTFSASGDVTLSEASILQIKGIL